jgi:ribosome-associated protein
MKESTARTRAPEVKEKAEKLLRAALSKKAHNPVLLNLEGLSSLTDYFLIVSGNTERQVTAISEAILESARQAKLTRFSKEGVAQGNWALLDYGDVIVHIFRRPVREFYDLEGLWIEAEREEFSEDIKKEIHEADALEDVDEWEDFETFE